MVGRGAKGTPAEFNEVIDYLAKNLSPNQPAGKTAVARPGNNPPPRARSGPSDKQEIDAAAAERGETLYKAECADCHGPQARGSDEGPDLVRSVTVLHDRYGNDLEPLLSEHHPMPDGGHLPALSHEQIVDLSHFLHQQVQNTLRSGPYTKVLDVLTGDPKAGAAYFNGAGGCNKCHSVTGDLAGVASRYEAPALQQRFLFPRVIAFSRNGMAEAKAVTVMVTQADGKSTSGTLLRMDDFNVSLRDADGNYHAWKRTPQVKVEKHDPYATHDALLDKYTDPDIHNVVAYLETLK
jgi:mono/diheme cytochrome c family protein